MLISSMDRPSRTRLRLIFRRYQQNLRTPLKPLKRHDSRVFTYRGCADINKSGLTDTRISLSPDLQKIIKLYTINCIWGGKY